MAATAGVKRPRERFRIAFTQDYEETSVLGIGGFGVVVKARHRSTGEAVAIKRARRSGDDGSRDKREAQAEVLQEAQFLDACKGLPFVVGYHGRARDLATSELCLFMEFVGPSLDAYLADGPPLLPEPTVRSFMWQLLTGARGMHDRHIVHRDIKPGNILVGGDGNKSVKICDLGLAISTKLPPPYTQAGTLPYMAPGMLLGKTDYYERVDRWSLGCVMAELILRRPLFEGDDDDDDEYEDNEEVGQLDAIFNVLGVPDGRTWRGFKSLPLANEVTNKLQKQRRNRLREIFPAERLSKKGFDVLSGLLTSNPTKRLTASAALKMPWFNNVEALSLPEKDVTALLKRKRVVVVPPATPKKKRIVIKVKPPRVLCAAA